MLLKIRFSTNPEFKIQLWHCALTVEESCGFILFISTSVYFCLIYPVVPKALSMVVVFKRTKYHTVHCCQVV